MGLRRTGKFWLRNENEVMESLGLKQTAGSGNGWVAKEDGSNEHILCQLKSTDAQSISVKLKDIKTLEGNAAIEHKLPVFAVQFLSDGSVYLLVSPSNIQEVARYLDSGSVRERLFNVNLAEADGEREKPAKTIGGGREAYMERHSSERDERKRSAKW
jgi:hypothetical protein